MQILNACLGVHFCPAQARIDDPYGAASGAEILMNLFDRVFSTVARRNDLHCQIGGAKDGRTASVQVLEFFAGHESNIWSSRGVRGQLEFRLYCDPSQPMRLHKITQAIGYVITNVVVPPGWRGRHQEGTLIEFIAYALLLRELLVLLKRQLGYSAHASLIIAHLQWQLANSLWHLAISLWLKSGSFQQLGPGKNQSTSASSPWLLLQMNRCPDAPMLRSRHSLFNLAKADGSALPRTCSL